MTTRHRQGRPLPAVMFYASRWGVAGPRWLCWLISIPAGLVELSLPKFLLYSTLGTAIWTALLAGAECFLQSRYDQVAQWLNPVTNVILGSALVGCVYQVAPLRPE